MRSTGLIVLGAIVAVCGLVFTLQGAGLLKGSAMTGSTFWTIAGPVIVVIGLWVARTGWRARVD